MSGMPDLEGLAMFAKVAEERSDVPPDFLSETSRQPAHVRLRVGPTNRIR